MTAVAEAIKSGRLPGRLWLYSNYHCTPNVQLLPDRVGAGCKKRRLGPDRMLGLAREAADLGFSKLGVTGGEPFIELHMADTLASLAEILPVVVLTNGTLFTKRRLQWLRPLAQLDVKIQISLDSSDPVANDTMRGPDNFRKVVEAIPRLVDLGIRVRIATTCEHINEVDLARLCTLHRELGVPDEDHIVRPVIRRGRAVDYDMGIGADASELPPELTITADGAFWSAFGPTVHGGRLDTDLLVTRATSPLRIPAMAMLRLLELQPGPPPNGDSEFI